MDKQERFLDAITRLHVLLRLRLHTIFCNESDFLRKQTIRGLNLRLFIFKKTFLNILPT